MKTEDCQVFLKTILIGDMQVGKTSLFTREVFSKFRK